LVCFAAFEYLRVLYKDVDIYTLLRTPPEELKIPAEDLNKIIENLKERLKEMNKSNMVLLSPEIRFTTEKLIDHGMSNINLFHANSPLLRANDGSHYYSEDIKLLYYYHNRLEGYGLEKYVK
jgi:glycerol-3-phosphate O-acyltransferase